MMWRAVQQFLITSFSIKLRDTIQSYCNNNSVIFKQGRTKFNVMDQEPKKGHTKVDIYKKKKKVALNENGKRIYRNPYGKPCTFLYSKNPI